MIKEKTFGDGYTYNDLVNTCSFYALEGLGTLRRGIDGFILNEYQTEFLTELDYREILTHFGKTLYDLKKDVVNHYKQVRRMSK